VAVLWKVRHSAAGGNYRRWTHAVVGSPSASYAYIELAANTWPRLWYVRMSWALPEDEVQLFFSPEGLVVVAPLRKGTTVWSPR
jgi:hypothetical protein